MFDLAFALSLIQRENLAEKVGWQPTLFFNDGRLPLPAVRVPREVDTVINHRVLKGRHVVAGVSGGVWLDAGQSLEVRIAEQPAEVQPDLPVTEADQAKQPWWWD